MTIIIILLIALVYLALLTQFELRALRRRAPVRESDAVFGLVELAPRHALFFILLGVMLFFHYFSGGVLGAVVLAPLAFFLFILCS